MTHKNSYLFLAGVFMMMVGANGPCAAQTLWTDNGVPVCVTAARQQTPSLVGDGSGGVIVTWADQTAGSSYDIYAQRVDSNGNVMWGSVGVPICTAAYDQLVPAIAPDGRGGAIIAWQDGRNTIGEFDIYAQRISADGVALWASDGVPVSAAPIDQLGPLIVPDGAGGAFVAFKDTRADPEMGSTDIYIQRIAADGTVAWASDLPIAVTPLQDDRDIAMVSDGSGGAIVAWVDGRGILAVPSTSNNIYAQRVNSSGNLVWGTTGVGVCTAGDYQRFPDLASDGTGGAVVCWDDRRNGIDYDVYAQRLSADGLPQWPDNGVPVATGAGGQMVPTIQHDGAGGAVIAWTDSRAGTSLSAYDIRAQRVSDLGIEMWTESGVLICAAPGWQGRVKSAIGDSGRTFFAWSDNRADPTNSTSNYDLYSQLLDHSGSPFWVTDGSSVCVAGGRQDLHQIAATSNGSAVIAWQDARLDANKDIYAQKIGNGTPLNPENLAAAKALPNGAKITLDAKLVSAVYDGFFYIQELDRSSGIRVTAAGVQEGQSVGVTGVLAIVDGERVIVEPTVSVLSSLVAASE